MRGKIIYLGIFAVALWLVFAIVLLGGYRPDWLPVQFLKLDLPKTTADLGQSFSFLDGLLSSLALMLGLYAIVIQIRQQFVSNAIGAYSVRLQFLLTECDRLESQIQRLKACGTYDPTLFNNMAEKKKRYLKNCREIDLKLEKL
jgi:hypothetical protein